MSGKVKVLLAAVFLIVIGLAGNVVGNMANRSNIDSDELAQSLAAQINQRTPPSSDFYAQFNAQKDPGGPGIVLNYRLQPESAADVKSMEEKDVRQQVINFYGAERLKNVVNNGLYLIFNLNDGEGKLLKTVTISKSILGA